MLTDNDLIAEIDKYENKANLTPDDCVRLAAYYTLLYSEPIKQSARYNQPTTHTEYSFTYNEPQPTPEMPTEERTENIITVDGDSDFFTAIDGRKASEMWAVMDELMSTLEVINPRLYEGVMRKINA